jgi:hypothetical protein
MRGWVVFEREVHHLRPPHSLTYEVNIDTANIFLPTVFFYELNIEMVAFKIFRKSDRSKMFCIMWTSYNIMWTSYKKCVAREDPNVLQFIRAEQLSPHE